METVVMWQAVGLVSSGVTLVAFLAAVSAWAYRRKLISDAELIRTAPESERAKLVLAHYGYLANVDTSPLTKVQKVTLVNRQLDLVAEKYKIAARVIVIVAILASAVTAFALWQNTKQREAEVRLEEKHKQLAEIRVESEKLEAKYREEQRRGNQLAGGVRFVVITAQPDVNPDTRQLVSSLNKLLTHFNANFDDSELSRAEELEIRLSKAGIAKTARRYRDVLAIVTEDDLTTGLEATAAAIDREIRVLEVRGDAFYGLHEWAKALQHYEGIVRRRPGQLSAVHLIGSCLHRLGRLKESLDAYNVVVFYIRTAGHHKQSELLAQSLNGRGLVLRDLVKLDDAEKEIGESINVYAQLVDKEGRKEFTEYLALVRNNRGATLKDLNRYEEAFMEFDKAIGILKRLLEVEKRWDLEFFLALAMGNRGLALIYSGKPEVGLGDCEEAVRIDSSLLERHHELGTGIVNVDSRDLKDELSNQLANSLCNRGVAFSDLERPQDAFSDFDTALRIYRDLFTRRKEYQWNVANCLNNRGTALADLGRIEDSLQDYEESVSLYAQLQDAQQSKRLAPSFANVLNAVAWTYATCQEDNVRNGTSAVKYAIDGCELTNWANFDLLDTLAAGYAEKGDFDAAAKWAQKALSLANDAKRDEIKSRLELFRSKKPYRE